MKLTKGKLSKLFNKKKQSRKKNKYNKKKHRKNNTYNNNNNRNINLANKTLKKIKVGGVQDTNINYISEDEEDSNLINQDGFDSVNNMSNILSSYKEE